MRLSVASVLERLVAEGLAPPEAIERSRAALAGVADTSPPWFARVVAGLGAWVATGFLIGFLVVTKIVSEEVSAMVVGAVLVAAAVYVRRTADTEDEFKRQLAFAGSLAGQLLIVVGIVGETRSTALGGLAAVAMSILLVPLVPDAAHRFMSGLIGSIGALAAAADLRAVWVVGDLGPLGNMVLRATDLAALAIIAFAAYVWRVSIRERTQAISEMLEAVGYGSLVGLFAVMLFGSIMAVADHAMRGPQSLRANAWQVGPLTTLGITAALIRLELAIFSERGMKPWSRPAVVAVGATALLGLVTLSTPGLIAAVAALTLGFDRRNRILIGIAILFLVGFASVYYYSLQLTLLEKAMVLVASGAVLLAARAYVQLRYTANERGG